MSCLIRVSSPAVATLLGCVEICTICTAFARFEEVDAGCASQAVGSLFHVFVWRIWNGSILMASPLLQVDCGGTGAVPRPLVQLGS